MRSHIIKEASSTASDQSATPWWKRIALAFTVGQARRLRREQFLALAPTRVFQFLAEGANLESTVPQRFRFQLRASPPCALEAQQTFEVLWKLWGRSFAMRLFVSQSQTPRVLELTQRDGPFRLWRHTCRLKPTSGGTWIVDELEYLLPWGICGALFDRLIARRKLEELFDYRQERLVELLLADVTWQAQSSLAGASHARARRPQSKVDPPE